MSGQTQRFIGLDVHKAYLVAAAVDKRQNLLMAPQRVNYADLADWITRELRPTDAVVLEACSNAWTIYDQLEPHVAQVIVAHASHVKLIANSLIKTDKRDALALARLLAADLVPPVWVPPDHVRDLRALVHHRRKLVERRAAAKSQLRALLARHHIVPPPGDIAAPQQRAWWDTLALSIADRFITRQLLAVLDHLTTVIQEAERELAQLSVSEQWCGQVACLLQLPGVSMLGAMTILGAIGDITRFPTAKKLVGYSGLGARVYSSGQKHYSGGITKAGRKELRTALIEAAWVAVNYDPFWQHRFETLAQRRGRGRAIAAIARKMLVVIWHLLTDGEADRFADPNAVARRFMRWGATSGMATSLGLSRAAFTRRELDRLKIGQTLDSVRFGGRMNPLPASGSVPIS
jgi:transposase